jgi:Zn-dependent protease
LSWLLHALMLILLLWPSLTVHEYAHAYAAARLGDPTGAREGRLTLNPLAHVDPVGTFLLPLLGVPFGWARPVPVNPKLFRRDVDRGRGFAITAAAGPAANVALGVVAAVGCGAAFAAGAPGWLTGLLMSLVAMNLHLAAFNLLPLVPLDGSRVADYYTPRALAGVYAAIREQTLLALIIILAALPRVGIDVFAPLDALGAALIRAAATAFGA